ncbi:hypothetical protein LTR95_012489 [Oleoguttula sp. CCFEE 5521]
MVSEINLDLTAVGDRVATEIRHAFKDLKLIPNNDLTADDIGRSVGVALQKPLNSLQGSIDEGFKKLQTEDKLKTTVAAGEDQQLSIANKTDTSKLSDPVDHKIDLDACTMRDIILMHASCFWQLHHGGAVSALYINIAALKDHQSEASVVYIDSQDMEVSCGQYSKSRRCGLRGTKHVHDAREATILGLISGPSTSSDFRALQALYLRSKEVLEEAAPAI